MSLRDEYTTEQRKQRGGDGETGKITLSEDAFAICEFLEKLIRMERLKLG